MPKKTLIILAIIIVLILIIGLSFSYGYWFKGKEMPESKLAQLEKSKVASSWLFTANGEITEISGRSLTLTEEEESLTIPIKESAKIVSLRVVEPLAEPVEGAPVETEEKEIKFEDLKIGDRASILVEVKATGELEGSSIALFLELPSK
jgi:uncharacterized protein YpmB